jgi:hypothetical protein
MWARVRPTAISGPILDFPGCAVAENPAGSTSQHHVCILVRLWAAPTGVTEKRRKACRLAGAQNPDVARFHTGQKDVPL